MKKYILYDSRAIFGDTDKASILSVSESLKEIKKDKKNQGGCIFSYDVTDKGLTNETQVW